MILSRPAVSFDTPEGGNIVLRYQSDMPESDSSQIANRPRGFQHNNKHLQEQKFLLTSPISGYSFSSTSKLLILNIIAHELFSGRIAPSSNQTAKCETHVDIRGSPSNARLLPSIIKVNNILERDISAQWPKHHSHQAAFRETQTQTNLRPHSQNFQSKAV